MKYIVNTRRMCRVYDESGCGRKRFTADAFDSDVLRVLTTNADMRCE